MCVECGDPSQVVDHIVPINQGGDPWSVDNMQAMCHACHNRKSGKEAHIPRRSSSDPGGC